MSKGLVEAHGGNLTLGDAPDGGARFIIRLPNEMAQASEAEAVRPAAKTDQPAPNRHFLVVDDDVAIAERLGYAVTVTHGANEARAKIPARDGKFDAILCDIRMPAGDGPGLYDWLCEHHLAIRSGLSDDRKTVHAWRYRGFPRRSDAAALKQLKRERTRLETASV